MTNLVDDYGWKTAHAPESCGYIFVEIEKILKNLKVEKICDLGSGNGALVGDLRSRGFNVAGVEYDKSGVEIARNKFPGINFYHMGVQDDPAVLLEQEGKFDAVVSTEVIEHLFSPHLLPQFAGKIVKPNGYLVVSTPYHGYLKNMALSVANKWDKHHTALWHGGHIKFWSRRTLAQLLRENGFEFCGFHGAGRLPWLWKSMILVAKKI